MFDWPTLAENYNNLNDRINEFIVSYAKGPWVIQATGRYCDGLEVFRVDDVTRKMAHLLSPATNSH